MAECQISHLWQQGTVGVQTPCLWWVSVCFMSIHHSWTVFGACMHIFAGVSSPCMHKSIKECCYLWLQWVVGHQTWLPSFSMASHVHSYWVRQLTLASVLVTSWHAISLVTSLTYHDIGGIDVVCAFPTQGRNANPWPFHCNTEHSW